MREVVLDTETAGISAKNGHRIAGRNIVSALIPAGPLIGPGLCPLEKLCSCQLQRGDFVLPLKLLNIKGFQRHLDMCQIR